MIIRVHAVHAARLIDARAQFLSGVDKYLRCQASSLRRRGFLGDGVVPWFYYLQISNNPLVAGCLWHDLLEDDLTRTETSESRFARNFDSNLNTIR